ncbi:MAG: Mth938-like domain-containing protein [Rhodospirillales bacterium]
MSLTVTPAVPGGKQTVDAYGDGGFRIAGARYEGSVIVFPDRTIAWDQTSAEGLGAQDLRAVTSVGGGAEILLLGCGAEFLPVPKGLRAGLKAHGLVLEWMDTPAACRTFNVLLAEDRRFAAALIAI